MTRPPLGEKLSDVAAGLLTPFAEDDPNEIRWDELGATANWLYDEGIRLLLACANISEFHSLTHDERIESVRVACEALPEDATVLAGVGGSTHTTVELAREAERNGADGLMVMPPDHTFKHERGVARHYDRIADAVDIGVVPYIRGIDVTVDLVDRITAHDQVAGVKWAIDDIVLFSQCRERADDDVVWMCGMAEPPAPAYYWEGAAGFSAGVSNFHPTVGLALFDALEAGHDDRARAIRNLCHPLMNLRADPGTDNLYPGGYSVQVVKEGLRLAGQYGGSVRDPLVELPESRKAAVAERYESLLDGLEELEVTASTP